VPTQSGQTICLCMIVKNEAPVIARCLASVLPIIDCWVIVDTGSTDGTQDIIWRTLQTVPGALYDRPWRDFAHNRSEALALARPEADFSLIIDADDALELAPDYRLPALDRDSYFFDIHDVGIRYQRQQIVANRRAWRYEGVLHEFLVGPEADGSGHLPVILRRNHDGARRRDPLTYQRDAEVLERALAGEVTPFLRSRYSFYLAQSYRDCRQRELAIKWYLARAAQGFWAEEVFYSLYQAGQIMLELEQDAEQILRVWEQAIMAAPARAEAAHAAARLCRLRGEHARGFAYAYPARDLTIPADGLFVERWIYDYGLLDELGVLSFWCGTYRVGAEAGLKALASGAVPAGDVARFAANIRFCFDRLGMDGTASVSDVPALEAPRRLHARLTAPVPRVLIAILAKQKEPVLEMYLAHIEALDYPKSSIVLSIRTNNNTDRTSDILAAWARRVAGQYAHIEFNDTDLPERVERFGVHEWNAERFSVLGRLRQESLERTLRFGCDFYFVADVDNFIRPETLAGLVALNLPIVAPLLRIAEVGEGYGVAYSNYHADIDANGYYKDSARYYQILNRGISGLIEVPVVHCTYLVRADVIPHLTYLDGSGRYEYVIFADSARRAGIMQYVDNRQIYGYLSLAETTATPARIRDLMAPAGMITVG